MTADEEERVWLFLHSGSRGVDNEIAQRHIAVASELAEKWWIRLPHPDLGGARGGDQLPPQLH